MLVATPATGLAGMPGVNLDYSNAAFLRLVGNEIVELVKAPTVQTAFVRNILVLFAAPYLGGVPDVREIFEDKGTARGSLLNDTTGKDMIAVPVETSQLFAQLFQVALSRLRSVGLQFSSQAEIATIHFFPVAFAQKLALRGDGWSGQGQIY